MGDSVCHSRYADGVGWDDLPDHSVGAIEGQVGGDYRWGLGWEAVGPPTTTKTTGR